MGILKWLISKFSCKSDCQFNTDDLPDDFLDIDLNQYRLKKKDLQAVFKIMNKRPSKNTHRHYRVKKIGNLNIETNYNI
tara:strand:+ start:1598 stop:1834 length:237 start_codon:yes stop_codon:yes gene_type:complete